MTSFATKSTQFPFFPRHFPSLLTETTGCTARAVQHACQLTFLSDATLPATVMYDRDRLLAKKDAFSEPAASVCHTFRQLGIHKGLSCQSKRKKKRPYRARRRKQQGRPIPELLSSRNEHSTCLRQRCDSRVNSCNLIHVPLLSPKTQSRGRTVALFNARSVGTPEKRTEMSSFILDNDIDLLFLTETWLRPCGDEAKCADLAPSGYAVKSSPAPFGVVASPLFPETVYLHLSLHRPPSLSITLPVN